MVEIEELDAELALLWSEIVSKSFFISSVSYTFESGAEIGGQPPIALALADKRGALFYSCFWFYVGPSYPQGNPAVLKACFLSNTAGDMISSSSELDELSLLEEELSAVS